MSTETEQTPEQLEALRKRLETEHTNEGPVLEPTARCIPVVIPIVATRLNQSYSPDGITLYGNSISYSEHSPSGTDRAERLLAFFPKGETAIRSAQLGETASLVIATSDVEKSTLPDLGIAGTPRIESDAALLSAVYP